MFTEYERNVLRAVAEAVIPPGKYFDGGGEKDVEKIESYLQEDKQAEIVYKAIIHILDYLTRISKLRGFCSLRIEERRKLLEKWSEGSILKRAICEVLITTLKVSHFSDDGIYSSLGCIWDKSPKSYQIPPYMSNVQNDIDGNEIECDVVVVGSGAGGAVVAKELAEKGFGVIILEEGKYYTRKDFTGKAGESFRKFYREKGLTFAIGNAFIPIPMGKMVGGSTAINTGTSWRTPPWILEKWVKEFNLRELSPEKMEKYFEKVEKTIQVEETKRKVIGKIADVIARGCEALGYNHYPVKRNAPECDGQGVCTFGCPTDAKKSTNISYIPMALKDGALLLEETRFKKLIMKNRRVEGVIAQTSSGKEIQIRAKVVVLSCGGIMTPFHLLQQDGFKNKNIGKNLTIHPATSVLAYCPNDDIRQYNHVPQGYCVDTFMKMGILLLHGGLPIDAGAGAIPFIGEKFSFAMSNIDKIASFGAMIEDDPSGIVFPIGRRPFVFYWIKEREKKLLKLGTEIVIKIFLSAGSHEIWPMIRKCPPIKNWRDYEKFLKMDFPPHDYILSAFHPLGTCRMGICPSKSVVDENHKVWDTENLYIVDGSVVPSSIGVNPQITIMALATRAAEKVAERLKT